MELNNQDFVSEYKKIFEQLFAYSYEEGSVTEQFIALGTLVKNYYSENQIRTARMYQEKQVKQVYYFSMEYLPGRMLKSNLLNLGIYETVRSGLKQLGLELDTVAKGEVDPALGNGGLGRLASCFMDSIASSGLPGNGTGIRYRYGLFKQRFINGYQVELPENWLRNENVWEVRKENKAVIVRFGGQVYLEENEEGRLVPRYENTTNILAVPYDTAQVGYRNGIVNNLRLWSAEIPYGEEDHFNTYEKREAVNEITEVLYPDDTNYEGRMLRVKQEYFLSSAGVQSIVRYFKQMKQDWSMFPDKIAMHINDTHPTFVIPELMRIFIDEEGLTWAQAWEITKKTVSYTNHTIMQEALETWPAEMIEKLLPRIAQIIYEINRRHIEKKIPLYGEELSYRTAIVANGMVRMANLAIIGSHSVNGVAKLHTDILVNDTLHDFYIMYPNKFSNKTNGITQRRWLQISNEGLTELLDHTIGNQWKYDPEELKLFKTFVDNDQILESLAAVKLANKQRFADYVKENMKLTIDPQALFDVQIKRLHAYKRQLLNLMHILDLYLRLKDNPALDIPKRVFIFGAKAAPSYHYAKEIIKVINATADLINKDSSINDKIKIVFVENYGVSLAELIIPAADLSEQISLAGKEASGTSNMKLMSNGAVTMATLDGANIEIKEQVGSDNIYIFGMTSEEVDHLRSSGTYQAKALYDKNPRLQRVLNMMIDGSIPGIVQEGRDIFDSLIKYNDEYFLLKDFDSYLLTQKQVDADFPDQKKWQKMALMNVANAGRFSADYTIRRYADEIWKIQKQ